MSEIDFWLWALCVWREFRGESDAAMTAGAWTMRNRLDRKTFGTTMQDVVTRYAQFSAMTIKCDPNTVIWPNQWAAKEDAGAWIQVQGIVQLVARADSKDDPTHGATHYYARSISEPGWASAMRTTAKIGRTVFLA